MAARLHAGGNGRGGRGRWRDHPGRAASFASYAARWAVERDADQSANPAARHRGLYLGQWLPAVSDAGRAISTNGLGKVGTTGNTPCGACGFADGIPPFAALGLDAVTAKDGWGRWITMHVDRGLTGGQPYVPGQTGLIPCSADETSGGLPGCGVNDATRSGLCRANLPNTERVTLNLANGASAAAAVVFVSHGANGYGAYRQQPSSAQCTDWRLPFLTGGAACSNPLGRERCNDKCQSPNHTFWLLERSERFDDVIVHIGRNALVSLFGNAACTTPW